MLCSDQHDNVIYSFSLEKKINLHRFLFEEIVKKSRIISKQFPISKCKIFYKNKNIIPILTIYKTHLPNTYF